MLSIGTMTRDIATSLAALPRSVRVVPALAGGTIFRDEVSDALVVILRPALRLTVKFDAEGLVGENPQTHIAERLKTAMKTMAVELRKVADELEAVP
jgi:hypothetical protein